MLLVFLRTSTPRHPVKVSNGIARRGASCETSTLPTQGWVSNANFMSGGGGVSPMLRPWFGNTYPLLFPKPRSAESAKPIVFYRLIGLRLDAFHINISSRQQYALHTMSSVDFLPSTHASRNGQAVVIVVKAYYYILVDASNHYAPEPSVVFPTVNMGRSTLSITTASYNSTIYFIHDFHI